VGSRAGRRGSSKSKPVYGILIRKGGNMNHIVIVDQLIDENLELILSPFYRDSVGGEELNENTQKD